MANSGFSPPLGGLLVASIALGLSSPVGAATAVEIAGCWHTYSALENPIAQAKHRPLAAYISARVANVRPPLLKLRSQGAKVTDLQAEEIRKSKRVASQMAVEVSAAISRADDTALRAAMAPVFSCDQVFGFTSFPLPRADASTKEFSPKTTRVRGRKSNGAIMFLTTCFSNLYASGSG